MPGYGVYFLLPAKSKRGRPFYEQLQAHDWYYLKWRWDFDVTASLIGASDSVLEVGCGDGQFLAYLKIKTLPAPGWS
jgi:tRNA G46 methylase TrmB